MFSDCSRTKTILNYQSLCGVNTVRRHTSREGSSLTRLPVSCVIIARSFTPVYRYFCFKQPVVFLDATRVLGSVNCCFSPNMESILSNIFPHHSHPFPSGTPSMHMLEYSILSHKSPRLCSFFFKYFFSVVQIGKFLFICLQDTDPTP